MSTVDVLQLIGTLALTGLGLLSIRVGHSAERFSRYGRETLVALGVFLLFAAGVRILDLLDYLSPEWARVANGLGAVVCLAIVAQLAVLTRIEHRLHRPTRR